MDRHHSRGLMVLSMFRRKAALGLLKVLSEHLKKAITVAIGVFQAREKPLALEVFTRAGCNLAWRRL